MLILLKPKDMTQVKKSGIKLHIGVDILGLPHTMLITTANVTDREGAIAMLTSYASTSDIIDRLQKVLVDGGYTGEAFAQAVNAICGAEVEVAKEMNYTNLLLFPKGGVLNALLDGWTNADVSGRTVRG